MTIDQMKLIISSGKSAERRKAAKKIGINKTTSLGECLLTAYLKESKSPKTWETQHEMIKALGLIEYKKALPIIDNIVGQNQPYSMISNAAAQSYVRLKRKSIKDSQPIIQLLKKGSLSIIEGALMPLAYDKMLPPNNEIIELIELGFDLNKHSDRIGKERGYTDPRYSLAAACAGWDKRLTLEFLNHCLATADNDHMLEQVALNSLKQKYSNLR